MTPDPWLEAHSYLRPSPTSRQRSIARRPGSRSSRRTFPTGMTTARTFSPVCLCSRAPMQPLISSRAAEWRWRYSGRLPLTTPDGSPPTPALSMRSCGTSPNRKPYRGLSVGRRDPGTVVTRSAALCGLDGDGAVPSTHREGLRRLARRRAVASQELPDVRILAGDGSTGRRRPWAQAPARRAVAAARAGSSSEPAARSVKPTPNGSRV